MPIEPRRLKRGVGRDALIEAAIALVAESGLSRLTYRSLAAKADVTHGSVQHHFGSIEAVLEAALKRSLEISLAPTKAAQSPSEYIRALHEVMEIDPDVHIFLYELILESNRTPRLRPHVRRLYAAYWHSTREALRSMGLVMSRSLVRAVYAATEGIAFQLMVLDGGDPGGLDDALVGLRRLLENALAAQRSGNLDSGLVAAPLNMSSADGS